MDTDMRVLRNKSILFFALALLCAFGIFLAIFLGHIDHFLAAGGAILAALGFVVAFNRAWTLWEEARHLRVVGHMPEYGERIDG
jgi:hypothetical protein